MSDAKKSATKPDEPPAVKPALRYIGAGASLPDVPARDLMVDEIEALAETSGPQLVGNKGKSSFRTALLESGLYKEG
ncbi:MAG TPA: hypothetical protein VGQ93_00065 [Lysobacter sp.]|jgi:hypothetical protein|nr:hypothetical protein [Lysobacter sp.]